MQSHNSMMVHGQGSVPSCHGAIMPSRCHGSWTGVVGHPEKAEREPVAHVRSKAARALQKIKIILLCIVISVNMPTPHFYRKYAQPFSEGSFLKILW